MIAFQAEVKDNIYLPREKIRRKTHRVESTPENMMQITNLGNQLLWTTDTTSKNLEHEEQHLNA